LMVIMDLYTFFFHCFLLSSAYPTSTVDTFEDEI
jgi:hypothetical protein